MKKQLLVISVLILVVVGMGGLVCAGGEVLFFDDFEDGLSPKWEVSEYHLIAQRIVPGANAKFWNLQNGMWVVDMVWFDNPVCPPQPMAVVDVDTGDNYVLEVRLKFGEAAVHDLRYLSGLVLGFQDLDNYYKLWSHYRGHYLYQLDSAAYKWIEYDYTEGHADILKEETWYIIRMEVRGNDVKFFVKDEEEGMLVEGEAVMEGLDQGGKVGIHSWPGNRIYFDYFKVTALN